MANLLGGIKLRHLKGEIWEECKIDNAERGFTEENKEEWEQIARKTHEYPWIFNDKHNCIYKEGYWIGKIAFLIFNILYSAGKHQSGIE